LSAALFAAQSKRTTGASNLLLPTADLQFARVSLLATRGRQRLGLREGQAHRLERVLEFGHVGGRRRVPNTRRFEPRVG